MNLKLNEAPSVIQLLEKTTYRELLTLALDVV